MRFFMIYPNQWATGNKPIGIATLAAVLKQAGHTFKLFDFTQFDMCEGVGDRVVGERSLEFKRVTNPERLPKRQQASIKQVLNKLLEEIDAFHPDMIGVSALSDDYPLGLVALRHLRQHFSTPTIVGGVHASVDPSGIIQEPCVDMVCVGEGEGAIADIGQRVDRGEDISSIPNLWVKTPEGVVKNPVRPLIQDLDVLPYPDWEIYPEAAFFKPFDGHVYKYGDVEMSRGCPYTCSYCINVELQEVYRGKGEYHREKSVARVINEILWFKERYGIEFLRFWDETFLLMSLGRLEALADQYSKKVGIPFAMETTAQSVTPRTVRLLKKFGCASASLGLETGNVDLRKGVLDKNTDNGSYVRAFRLLREHNIRGVSFNMIGLPFERREDVFDTIRLNKILDTEAQSVGIFYPYKGTPIRTFCEIKGLLDKDFEFNLLSSPTANFITYTRGIGSALKLGGLSGEDLVRLRNYFSYYVVAPEWLWPLVDECGRSSEFSQKLGQALFECLYKMKFESGTRENGQALKGDKNGSGLTEQSDDLAVNPRSNLPPWLAPFLGMCEQDKEFGRKFLPWLMALWNARGQVSLQESSQSDRREVCEQSDEEIFNRGGQLPRSRLNEIRKEMRKIAKEDAFVLLSEIRRKE